MAELNQPKRSAFAGKMLGILNGSMLAMMISIGRQTGLLESLAVLPPSTSAGIAAATGLNERYVREWLGAMATGGIVEYDPEADTYFFPPEHAALLTNAAGARNMARFIQYMPMLAEVEEDVVACFRNGGGVPYSRYPRFQRLMSESSRLRFDQLLLDRMIPLTGLSGRLESGIRALDIGCGHGHATNLLAKAYPHSRFVGYDFSVEGIAEASAEARDMGNTNARFAAQDVSTFSDAGQYDLITAFDVIHDQARPAAVLRAISDALTDEGVFLMVDVRAASDLKGNLAHPLGPFVYGFSTMHCMTVSLALEGEGLGTAWGEQKACAMLREAGFGHVKVSRLEEDPMNNYYLARKR